MICRLVLAGSMALFLGLSCGSNPKGTELEIPDVTIVLRPTEAQLLKNDERVIEASESRISSRGEPRDSFEEAQFINKQTGWASTYRFIYTTSNGGKAWEKLPFKAPENSRISSFFFVDESRGWLAVWKLVFAERYGLGNSSTIFVTNDGGRTWREHTNFPDEVTIKQISFRDTNDGLVIGSRTLDRPRNIGPPYNEFFVLRTNNGGETWTDISTPIKDTLVREKARPGDSGWNVRWLSPTEILLLTRNGRVLRANG